MIDEKKRNELSAMVSEMAQYDEKEMKHYQVELLNKYVEKLDKFYELNKKEVAKLMMLLEYAVHSALDKEERVFNQRFKALRVHAQKHFKVFHEGELRQLGIGSGMAIGVSIGVALGAGFQNIAIGISIGISIGVAIGIGIGNGNEEKANQEGRIL